MDGGGARTEERMSGAAMQPLAPGHLKVLRVRAALGAAALLLAALTLDAGLWRGGRAPVGLATFVALGLGSYLAFVLPGRRYRAWGYREADEEIFIRSGLLIRSLRVVPFGRVQHIDVSQGPIQRAFEVATLTLHTAGTSGAAVPLPGLHVAEAEAMRDRIRAKIRQDLM